MDENNKNLYMVVNIDRTKKRNKQYPNWAWVSFANLQGRTLTKRWTDLSKNKQIKYGAIGMFDENKEFRGTQDYFDLENRYFVGQVVSVEKSLFLNRPVYKYHVGLANGDFDRSLVESSEQLATVGNWLLLHYDKYMMNLTTMENCWNLLNHYNVGKYGLRPSYSGLLADKYCPLAAKKEYKNSKSELVMPAVVTNYYGDNSFRAFVPSYIKNYYRDIDIVSSGVLRPLPRLSDIVLLDPTEEDGKFALMDNLTMSVELQDMQKKFGLPKHQAEMMEYYKKTFGERG